jgi:hypothetical protein
MAKLEAHGEELLRREQVNYRLSFRSDGKILRDSGAGWKLYKKVKPEINLTEYIQERINYYSNIPPENYFREEYRKLMVSEFKSLEKRQTIHTLIELLGNDIDGLWSELDDHGMRIELDDLKLMVDSYNLAIKEGKEAKNKVQN